jgi:hypothetical protein
MLPFSCERPKYLPLLHPHWQVQADHLEPEAAFDLVLQEMSRSIDMLPDYHIPVQLILRTGDNFLPQQP